MELRERPCLIYGQLDFIDTVLMVHGRCLRRILFVGQKRLNIRQHCYSQNFGTVWKSVLRYESLHSNGIVRLKNDFYKMFTIYFPKYSLNSIKVTDNSICLRFSKGKKYPELRVYTCILTLSYS